MEDTIIKFRACECPGTPHAEGDTVSLRPFLAFAAGAAALRILTDAQNAEDSVGALNERLSPHYIREGVTGWNLPEVYTPEALLELPFEEVQFIANAADDLYSGRILRPLAPGLNGSSPNGRTASTSATRRSSRKARKPASPSSPVTSEDGLSPVP